jgi:hydroxymethylbilane synthase
MIRVGTRGSRLALTQAEWVKQHLTDAHRNVEVRIEIIKTTGDRLKSAPLAVIGGQGVFTKELEDALLENRIDIAVHSLKDLPSRLPDALHLAAITEREDARDALVLPLDKDSANFNSLRDLPQGATVGTSSPRRLSQLKHLRPNLHVRELRGNVDTRLRKLDTSEYDAIILAAAGLRRLNLKSRISFAIPTDEMLPAIGQAALGLETRADDMATRSRVEALKHPPTHAACTSERALLRHLGGGCQFPIAGYAQVNGTDLHLRGLVADPTGTTIIRDELHGAADEAELIGEQLAARLLRQGAGKILFTSRI